MLPTQVPTIPIYRVLNSQGKVINPSDDPGFEKEDLVDMYKAMVKTSVMDRILYQSQRQGHYYQQKLNLTLFCIYLYIIIVPALWFRLALHCKVRGILHPSNVQQCIKWDK